MSPDAKEEITLKSEILKLLKSTNEYVSGQELCEKFGVSRTAIWKAIEGLKKDGYEIEAVRNRGYKLAENGSDVFCQRELSSQIAGISLIKEAVFFDALRKEQGRGFYSLPTGRLPEKEDGEEAGSVLRERMRIILYF